MALDDTYTYTSPGQINGAGSRTALHIEQFNGEVLGTIERLSVMTPFIKVDTLTGTSIMSTEAIGQSTLQVLTPGANTDGTVNKFGKKTLSVDTVLLARSVVPLLDQFQNKYDVRMKIAREHGKLMAKQHDEAFCIQAAKAGALTANTFGLTAAGHDGASQVTMGGALDHQDPALLYQKIVDLITAMRLKDVDPVMEGGIFVTTPDVMATLSMAELLINTEYKTSDGTNVPAMVLKAHGVPVVMSNNYPGGRVITGNKLSNAGNSNAYDGDFTKNIGTLLCPEALMAAETIAVTSDVFFDKLTEQWFVDAWRSYAVGPKNAVLAGNLLKP